MAPTPRQPRDGGFSIRNRDGSLTPTGQELVRQGRSRPQPPGPAKQPAPKAPAKSIPRGPTPGGFETPDSDVWSRRSPPGDNGYGKRNPGGMGPKDPEPGPGVGRLPLPPPKPRGLPGGGQGGAAPPGFGGPRPVPIRISPVGTSMSGLMRL